jgi:hypothetical protein
MYKFPSNKDFVELLKKFPFKRFIMEDCDFIIKQVNGLVEKKQLPIQLELRNWKEILHNLWYDVAISYAMLIFYKNQVKPDDPYYISPGKNGMSVEFFPKFEIKDHLMKKQFDFYCDVFFYKIFSALDVLWQLLNVYYQLGIKSKYVSIIGRKSTDSIFLKRLKKCNEKLYYVIKQTKKDKRFIDAKNFRNSVAHRKPAGTFSSGVHRLKNEIDICVPDYTSSDKVLRIITDFIDLCGDIIEKIKDVCKARSEERNHPAAD